jgi:hypothetical protein
MRARSDLVPIQTAPPFGFDEANRPREADPPPESGGYLRSESGSYLGVASCYRRIRRRTSRA